MSSVGVGSRLNSLINIIGRWSDKSVLTIALLQSLFKMQLVMSSMALCLVALVGLLIVGITLN